MARKKLKPQNAAAGSTALTPPPGGAAIRMYRIGHGDCFLIAFASDDAKKPAFVLIDCGFKPGSPGKLAPPTTVKEIGKDILDVTGGFIDVAIVTHEHQDHVNGLSATNFPGLEVGKVWFAWTENPKDDVANVLRKKFRDRLLGLIDVRANLVGLGREPYDVDRFLEFELGESSESFNGHLHLAAAGKDPAASANKLAMKFLRGCAAGDPDFLYPHAAPRPVPRASSARAFVLGPPRDVDKIDDLDPIGDETFDNGHALKAAAGRSSVVGPRSPFSRGHVIPLDEAFTHQEFGRFFTTHYGHGPVSEHADGKEVSSYAEWRRMSANDAAGADALALAMNNATNNTSLVLAFELSKGGKVLLFVGDAQAGNWRSWSDADFRDGAETVTAADLLGRTVLYKVGHHGSHNATLKGKAGSKTAGLALMAQGSYADEFVAMITAVEAWARHKPKPDWNHPLPAIKRALEEKAGGRVLQTDSGLPANPSGAGAAGWQSFVERVSETPLYFDLLVKP